MAEAQKVGPVDLSSMADNHPMIATRYFEEPAAYLLGKRRVGSAHLSVDCSQNARRKTEASSVLLEVRFTPRAYNFRQLVATLGQRKITEHAAVGLALLFLPYLAEGEVTEVCRNGDRTDYWVDGNECLLEISGTHAPARLRFRHRAKVAQGRGNPRGAPYFVSVSCFGNFQNVFSFHTVP